MRNTPVNAEIVAKKISEGAYESVGRASIREIKKLIELELKSKK